MKLLLLSLQGVIALGLLTTGAHTLRRDRLGVGTATATATPLWFGTDTGPTPMLDLWRSADHLCSGRPDFPGWPLPNNNRFQTHQSSAADGLWRTAYDMPSEILRTELMLRQDECLEESTEEQGGPLAAPNPDAYHLRVLAHQANCLRLPEKPTLDTLEYGLWVEANPPPQTNGPQWCNTFPATPPINWDSVEQHLRSERILELRQLIESLVREMKNTGAASLRLPSGSCKPTLP